MIASTQHWVRKAEGDYNAACILRRSRKRSRYDLICFLSQQCVEKYIKGRLNEASIAFQKTHDLLVLLELVRPIEPLWMCMEKQLSELTRFAVRVRYPGMNATREQATLAFNTCKKIRVMARAAMQPGD